MTAALSSAGTAHRTCPHVPWRAGSRRVRRLGCCLLFVMSGTAAAQATPRRRRREPRLALGVRRGRVDFGRARGHWLLQLLDRCLQRASARAAGRLGVASRGEPGHARRRRSAAGRASARAAGRSARTRCSRASARGARRPLDIQVGLIPPVFGAFSRRAYGTDNPLIGFPLGYQYVTTLRAGRLAGLGRRTAEQTGQRLARPLHGGRPGGGLRRASGRRAAVSGRRRGARGGRPRRGRCRRSRPAACRCPIALDVGWQPAGVRPRSPFVPSPASSSAARCRTARSSPVRSTDSLGAAGRERHQRSDRRRLRRGVLARAPGLCGRRASCSWWRLPPSAPPFSPEPLRAFAFDVEGRYRILPGAVRGDSCGPARLQRGLRHHRVPALGRAGPTRRGRRRLLHPP